MEQGEVHSAGYAKGSLFIPRLENEAKLYSCQMTGFKFCPLVFAYIHEIMLYWSQGTGDTDCHFKIKKNLENASVSLESTKSPGLFVGLESDGQAKPVIYTKNGNVFFYPQVVKCTFILKCFHFGLLCDSFVSDNFITFLLSRSLLISLFVSCCYSRSSEKNYEDHLTQIFR